jgi:hypothetical protein
MLDREGEAYRLVEEEDLLVEDIPLDELDRILAELDPILVADRLGAE